METNTVILSLFEYNALRDFRENLENGKTYIINGYQNTNSWCGYTPTSTYVTSDVAVEQIAAKNDELFSEVGRLKAEIYELKHPTKKETNIEDIKKMSVIKFIKWKKSLKKQ